MWWKTKGVIAGVGLLMAVLSSCYNDKEELLYGMNDCDPSNVSFAADIMPILSNGCAVVGCHVQGGSGVGLFENYNQVKAKVDDGSFEQRVIVQMDMPPSGPLSDCQIDFITEWLSQGAPNN